MHAVVKGRFHGNFCTSDVVRCASSFLLSFDNALHQMSIQFNEDSVVVFDALPEKWVPAVALWRPGDTVQVKLLPEATKDALRWCELNSKSRVVMVNDVTPDLFEFITVLVKDIVVQLREGREETRL